MAQFKTGKNVIIALRFYIALILLVGSGVLPCHAKPEAERKEIQRHGYVFEKWVRDTFFEGYALENYTQFWDVPAAKNKKYGAIPVQIKMTKYGMPVDLGDALRQYSVNEKFLLIIGYWKQQENKKRVVNIVAATVEPALYKKLWEPIELEDLQKLDALVKNRVFSPSEARAAAKKMKSAAPFSKAVMGVNAKIDSKTQRRVQCSLSFKEVFKYLAPKADPAPQIKPQLFGVDALQAFESAPRK